MSGNSTSLWESAPLIKQALSQKNTRATWRYVIQVSHNLAEAEPATRVALCLTEPVSTEDERFDALLAAIANYWLSRDSLPLPTWINNPDRSLTIPWDVESTPELQKSARKATPKSISRHGIYLAESELLSI